ncbi:endonuclease/exonuclease/phosphatase family protein [Thermomonospora umbrina]|uniref:endonuclease/exonuclease/phosphatase family protein n=1 Tax=Thermomonospora umbrina TaxID=111806 RepID=UPI001FECBF78|nr:endonuclease/exonuclease/phosphatase family protein [Thermomonospora umbrina]
MTFLRVLVRAGSAVLLAAGTVTVPALPSASAPKAARHVHDIQGAAHASPFVGTAVSGIPGVVLAVAENGFWMQGPTPDRDPRTSEGVFVFTRTRPTAVAGDLVRVNGLVGEFRPGGPLSANLSRTEIEATAVAVERRGVEPPPAVLLGPDGRRAPGAVIDDDVRGDVERSGAFEPERDGLDFYESLEGMRVAVDDAVAVGPRADFGEIPVLPSGGEGSGVRTGRGGIVLRDRDANPERVILDDTLLPLPAMNVGDRLPGRTAGVLDYGFGDFKLLVTSSSRVRGGGLSRERARPQGPGELAVATYSLKDLDPGDPPARFDAIARQIVTGLASPDLITVTGLQDNSGPDSDGTVAADQTVAQLTAAISAAGGPAYDWRSIDPVDGADGGEPGGNIRVGFLFRGDRGLAFVDRPGGTATAPVAAVPVEGPFGVRTAGLTASPGRIAPLDLAWNGARKPLAGEFLWWWRRIVVVANHWTARGGDDSPYGRFQPPRAPSASAHLAQARRVGEFVGALRAIDPNAAVIVAGDFNAPGHSPALRALTGGPGARPGPLRDPVAGLPERERYTVVSGGNAQDVDHILLSPGLARAPYEVDIVHLNAEFADQVTDHDPVLARIALP